MPATEKARQPLTFRAAALALPLITFASGVWSAERAVPPEIDALVKTYASAYAVPLDLARRLIERESGFNPRASSRGNLGLMQIRAATARGLGYTGPPEGLLVAETNLAYGMAYLANALMVARGDGRRAERYFQNGFYYEAKRSRMLALMIRGCEFKIEVGVRCGPLPDTRFAAVAAGIAPSPARTDAGPKVAQPVVAEASLFDFAIPVRKPVLPSTAALGFAAAEPTPFTPAPPKLLGAVILDSKYVAPDDFDPAITATADPLPLGSIPPDPVPLPRARPTITARMVMPRSRPAPDTGLTAISQLELKR